MRKLTKEQRDGLRQGTTDAFTFYEAEARLDNALGFLRQRDEEIEALRKVAKAAQAYYAQDECCCGFKDTCLICHDRFDRIGEALAALDEMKETT